MTEALVKVAAVLLSSEKGRKVLGWVALAICSPLILIILLLCSLGSGTASHNNNAVDICFYGGSISSDTPAEYRDRISEMQDAFAVLDSAINTANGMMEDNSLDSVRVKAVFYALCFDSDSPSQLAADNFVECFYSTEEKTRTVPVVDESGNPVLDENGEQVTQEETYTVATPRPLSEAYSLVGQRLGREITEDDQKNIAQIYARIAGALDGGISLVGDIQRGTGSSTDIDISHFTDPTTKNAHDLAAYAVQAWENGWGYVWGTTGKVMTESLLQSKLAQYPDNIGPYEDFIRANWLGRRTVDCCGLIKSYGWLNTETMTFSYQANGVADMGANSMYHAATVSGTIDAIPEIPGLAVWRNGHIGVYIGNGEVIEAMGTKYGVVRTKLAERNFTHWLQVPGIIYEGG